MNITLITVGKLKEEYLKDAVREYEKRLSRYVSLRIVETEDEKSAENAGENDRLRVMEKEGKRVLGFIREKDYVIALSIDGTAYSSEGLSEKIGSFMNQGVSDLDFVIGGSLGLSKEVLNRANERWSFSKLTFPHQLMRVIFLEQLYRSFKILRHEPYHK